MIEVDVAIVTYRNEPHIDRCLESLASAPTDVALTVIVVDNSPDDETYKAVRSWHQTFGGRLHIARAPDNPGFGTSSNTAAGMGNSQYILFLNPDTVLDPSVLSALVAHLVDKPSVGLVGCQLVLEDGSLDPACKRNLPTVRSSFSYFFARNGRTSYLAPEVANDAVAFVGAVNGALMLMRRSDFMEVGGFDERYWMYGEDLDLCARIADRGQGVLYVGTERAVHIKGGSSGRVRGWRTNFHFHWSMARYLWLRDTSPHLVKAVAVLGIMTRYLVTTAQYVVLRMRP